MALQGDTQTTIIGESGQALGGRTEKQEQSFWWESRAGSRRSVGPTNGYENWYIDALAPAPEAIRPIRHNRLDLNKEITHIQVVDEVVAGYCPSIAGGNSQWTMDFSFRHFSFFCV
jgi:hypothetical protein